MSSGGRTRECRETSAKLVRVHSRTRAEGSLPEDVIGSEEVSCILGSCSQTLVLLTACNLDESCLQSLRACVSLRVSEYVLHTSFPGNIRSYLQTSRQATQAQYLWSTLKLGVVKPQSVLSVVLIARCQLRSTSPVACARLMKPGPLTSAARSGEDPSMLEKVYLPKDISVSWTMPLSARPNDYLRTERSQLCQLHASDKELGSLISEEVAGRMQEPCSYSPGPYSALGLFRSKLCTRYADMLIFVSAMLTLTATVISLFHNSFHWPS